MCVELSWLQACRVSLCPTRLPASVRMLCHPGCENSHLMEPVIGWPSDPDHGKHSVSLGIPQGYDTPLTIIR
jgi:hypothetical protein